MGNSIRFTNFKIMRNSFTCVVESSKRDKADTLSFSLRPKVAAIENDAIACALATLCGKGYEKISMELEVSEKCLEELRKFTGAEIETAPGKSFDLFRRLFAPKRKAEGKYILNFSGGFDSMAAMALMPPEKRALVAIDFGGWFQREADFFEEFHPYTLTTNFRQLKYDRESWTFMGTGSLLFAGPLNAKHHVFGTILEASANNLRDNPVKAKQVDFAPFSILGIKEVHLMIGLTEVATAMIMTKFYPEKVEKSLASLAAATSEKRYRKQVLTEIVCERYGRDLQLPACKNPDEKQITAFGTYFATDFLALYELKHRGLEVVNRTVVDIPQEAIDLANSLSLEFYERLNTKFLHTIPDDIRPYYLERLEECGVVPYTEKDWEEFKIVRQFLGQYHPAVLD